VTVSLDEADVVRSDVGDVSAISELGGGLDISGVVVGLSVRFVKDELPEFEVIELESASSDKSSHQTEIISNHDKQHR
jgi:hypothetical protein